MENQHSLTKTNDRLYVETGLIVKDSFIAKSGFVYHTGLREFGDLQIFEGVATGTGKILLTSLLVIDKEGTLIFDADINTSTNYSREKVKNLVLNGLMNMLREATENQGKYFDELEAYDFIDQKLKTAIFETSYQAVLKWWESRPKTN